MADGDALERLRHGITGWNQWMRDTYGQADVSRADFSGADLRDADLGNAQLQRADLRNADLRGANLDAADLVGADLTGANLSEARLTRSRLFATIFDCTSLSGADVTGAYFGETLLANLDLRAVRGLHATKHLSPSKIGVDTLYRSAGSIPADFLGGCGVPEGLIAYLPSLVGSDQAIQFHSCFISYSTSDEEFAKRLHRRLREEQVRVWFAPEDIKGGQKLKDQIDRAIEMHDRLLVVLSEDSLASEWVMTEVRRARTQEKRENRRKLFPITLVPYQELRAFERTDVDTGEDLGAELRSYFIPDFSNWKHHDVFEDAFARLVRDLRAEERRE